MIKVVLTNAEWQVVDRLLDAEEMRLMAAVANLQWRVKETLRDAVREEYERQSNNMARKALVITYIRQKAETP
jgi:hypothetical protein